MYIHTITIHLYNHKKTICWVVFLSLFLYSSSLNFKSNKYHPARFARWMILECRADKNQRDKNQRDKKQRDKKQRDKKCSHLKYWKWWKGYKLKCYKVNSIFSFIIPMVWTYKNIYSSCYSLPYFQFVLNLGKHVYLQKCCLKSLKF